MLTLTCLWLTSIRFCRLCFVVVTAERRKYCKKATETIAQSLPVENPQCISSRKRRFKPSVFLTSGKLKMSDSSDEDTSSTRQQLHRVAKKSTGASVLHGKYPTRRQPGAQHQKTLQNANRFLENFNPETSVREKRKLNRKINPPSGVRRPPGALYDENGIHIASCTDLCDCLNEECPGCFFDCAKCGSQKCGIECRVHRKVMYDQVEYHGYDIIIKNPLLKM